jgi:hypothetical protein
MRWLSLSIAAGLVFMSFSAQAEYFGLMSGRSADLPKLPDTSIELGITMGDFGEADYQYFGLRYNYRMQPGFMVYGDVGQAELESFDGNNFGIGFFYVMEGIFEGTDFALKGNIHRATLKARGSRDVDLNGMGLEGVFSGREPFGANNNIHWYGNVGVHRISQKQGSASISDTEFGFGGGIVMPSKSGQLFAGIDFIDEITFGAGYRHFLQ